MSLNIIHNDCTKSLELSELQKIKFFKSIDLTFLDPPFNQNKEYSEHNDSLPEKVYWNWMRDICEKIYSITSQGGAIYFMQREKNTEHVLKCLRESGWNFQNLIIWKKKTSAVPSTIRFGKQYQIIAFATKGISPRVFNRLRINPPLPSGYKFEREKGLFLTDVWDDIRELTSGYFAGDEAIRNEEGKRIHKQQSPIHLLLRIILSSSLPGDIVLDPFAGTGTTSFVSEQLHRNSIAIEKDSKNIAIIHERINSLRDNDDLNKYKKYYRYTDELDKIWPSDGENVLRNEKFKQLSFV